MCSAPLSLAPGCEDRELVSSEPPDRVQRAHRASQSLDHPAQQLVAGGMAVHVVDRLEVVEVEQHERERVALTQRAFELGRHALLEPAPVEAPG